MARKRTWQISWVTACVAAVSLCNLACRPADSLPVGDGRATPDAALSITPVDGPQFQEWLAQQRGHWVLVDFWATWCAPCREKFPAVVAIERKYRERGLIVAAVSMDEPDDTEIIGDFLTEQGATFTAMVRSQPTGPAFETFGLQEVPTYHVYDPSGDLAATFAGEFEFSELETLLAEKLAESP